MLAALVPRLESGAAGPGIDPLDEPLLDEQVQHTVDARDADRPPGNAEAVVHLLRRQAALLLREETHHGVPRPAAAMAGGAEDLVCVFCPGHVR